MANCRCGPCIAVLVFTLSNFFMTTMIILRCMSQDALPRSMGLLGVARANTAVGVSPEAFLLLLLQVVQQLLSSSSVKKSVLRL
jgi:hypothetical protein